jgi:hypothetical protein
MDPVEKKKIIRRMRLTIWAGALAGTSSFPFPPFPPSSCTTSPDASQRLLGLFIALCIGAAFIAVFFTTLSDLWSKSEEIWEGVFSIIACIIIYVMGLTMLRIDRSKLKWKKKLSGAFDKKVETDLTDKERKEARSSKWTLFALPMVTVLREGLEAVVFVGGVRPLPLSSSEPRLLPLFSLPLVLSFPNLTLLRFPFSHRFLSVNLPSPSLSLPLSVSSAVFSSGVRPRRLSLRAIFRA